MLPKILPIVLLSTLVLTELFSACSSRCRIVKTIEVERGIQKLIPLATPVSDKVWFRKFDKDCLEWLEVTQNSATGQWEYTAKTRRRKAVLLRKNTAIVATPTGRHKEEHRLSSSALVDLRILRQPELAYSYLREQKRRLDEELVHKRLPRQPTQISDNQERPFPNLNALAETLPLPIDDPALQEIQHAEQSIRKQTQEDIQHAGLNSQALTSQTAKNVQTAPNVNTILLAQKQPTKAKAAAVFEDKDSDNMLMGNQSNNGDNLTTLQATPKTLAPVIAAPKKVASDAVSELAHMNYVHQIEIIAKDNSWAKVLVDNTMRTYYFLHSGQRQIIGFNRSLKLQLSQSNAVRVYYDGEEIPSFMHNDKELVFPPQ